MALNLTGDEVTDHWHGSLICSGCQSTDRMMVGLHVDRDKVCVLCSVCKDILCVLLLAAPLAEDAIPSTHGAH